MMALKATELVHPLGHFGAVPLTRGCLDEVVAGYQRPNDKISEWLREGALLPLRRGLYLTAEPLRSAPACLPLIANHLYGPSYVSLEFALAFHGLIPERVAEVTSVTPKPSRLFHNDLGRFSYHHLPLAFYRIGQQLAVGPDNLCFLIATPTKALCDMLALCKGLRLLSLRAMKTWLTEDLRIDSQALAALNRNELHKYLAAGIKKQQLSCLLRAIEQLGMEQLP